MLIKQGETSFNIVFKSDAYTNKLFGRNLKMNQIGGVFQLEVDYSHYASRKRNNLEDTDFEVLLKLRNEVSHAITSDGTVKKFMQNQSVTEVLLNLGDGNFVKFSVSGYDPETGYFR